MFSYYGHLVIAQSAPFMFFGLLQPAAGFLIFLIISVRKVQNCAVFLLLQMFMIMALYIIQGVSSFTDITAGNDFLALCDQKSSFKHVSNFWMFTDLWLFGT